MIFGERPVKSAVGTILAHSVRAGTLMLKKGRRLSETDLAALRSAGIVSVMVAELETGDVAEDDAALQLATAIAGPNLAPKPPFTGRVNLHATKRGLLLVDRERLDRVNLVSEALTVATLEPFALIASGDMAATIKIIPFSVRETDLRRCVEEAAGASPMLQIAPLAGRTAALIQTRLPGTKDGILDKTVAATRARLEALDSTLIAEHRCAHRTETLASAISEVSASGPSLLLISGASAITDRRDVIPAAIERAGGSVTHFGMPVDPGNLILLAKIGDVPVLGLPGCARSPKLNGFDWVLQRLLCGVPVTRQDIMRMGAGGLLTEIASRPQPRQPVPVPSAEPKVAAIVLAAGRSSRMGHNKLMARVDGAPLLLRTVDAALASRARPIVVVTGHESERVRAALGDRPVRLVHNPDYEKGLSTSLRCGLAALPPESEAAIVCLGDMPRIRAGLLDKFIQAFNPVEGRAICVPVWQGKRGNPVLWSRQLFAEMANLTGDTGAKHLLAEHPELVVEIPAEDDGILADVDTPEALAALS
ncbi:MAG TPA: molybdopterin-binding/glycosyltransferase family 2 protein [Alphaproteobacteria bacterium]|nr:molybdopterin-binding/glycosyltransferase family 2 protein [Alphaproteobacteria bacterium]